MNPSSSKPQQAKITAIRDGAVIDRDYARYELYHALLDGVFEPTRKIKDGELRFRKIEVSHDYEDPKTGKVHKDAVHLTLLVPYMLNPQAESVLLALIKLSGTKGLHDGIELEPRQPTLPMLFVPAEGNAKDKPIAITTVSQYQLLKEAGMSDGKSGYKLLEQYLTQMSQITVNYKNRIDGWFGSDHLISYHANEDGRLIVKLNWRLAGAIFGDYLFAEIDLKERRALKKDASKTLHRWLSAHLWKGKPRRYYQYGTLIKHTWTQPASAGAQRSRLLYLKRDILPEMGKLDKWTIEMDGDGVWITHHKEII